MTLDPKALAQCSIADLISLKGRRAVITGGARGLGLAIGCRLAEAGASLMIGDKNEPGAAEAAKAIAKDFKVKAHASVLDVVDSRSMVRFAEAAEEALGGIDIWVNNAGTFPAAIMTETSDEDWDFVNNVNLRGTFYGCREAGRRMEQGGPRRDRQYHLRGVAIAAAPRSRTTTRPSMASSGSPRAPPWSSGRRACASSASRQR